MPLSQRSLPARGARALVKHFWVVVVGVQLLLALYVLHRAPALSSTQVAQRRPASSTESKQARKSQFVPQATTLTALNAAGDCLDVNPMCTVWTQQDECAGNPTFMLRTCPDSCFSCVKPRRDAIAGKVKLRSGAYMPTIGFGTAGLGSRTAQAVAAALRAGYRLIDSAQAREWYREDLVGSALASSPVVRSQLFITTKVHPRDLGTNATRAAVLRSLSDLGTSYLDLVLLHYPSCWEELCGEGFTPEGDWLQAWRALEQLVREGVIRDLGVSNFDMPKLHELAQAAAIKPSVVQRYADPLHQDLLMRVYANTTRVVYQAYSSLGTQWVMAGSKVNPVLNHPLIGDIAAQVGSSPAQVVLHWALKTGQAVVPRSTSEHHIAQNLDSVHIPMTDEMIRQIDALDPSYT